MALVFRQSRRPRPRSRARGPRVRALAWRRFAPTRRRRAAAASDPAIDEHCDVDSVDERADTARFEPELRRTRSGASGYDPVASGAEPSREASRSVFDRHPALPRARHCCPPRKRASSRAPRQRRGARRGSRPRSRPARGRAARTGDRAREGCRRVCARWPRSVRSAASPARAGRRRRGSGCSRSGPPCRAASRGTSARCRTPRRSRSRRGCRGTRSPPPMTLLPPSSLAMFASAPQGCPCSNSQAAL